MGQLDKLREKGLNNSQIICAVAYWYDVLGKSVDDFDKYGFGIVITIYEDAERYYKRIKKEQEQKLSKIKEALANPPERVAVKGSPQRKIERRINSIEHEDWECQFRK